MTFVPNEKQAQALELIRRLPTAHPNGGAVMVLSGYAGTGKTSCLRALAEGDESFFVLAPTGKAATRVREAAGCDGLTIHRWCYSPKEDSDTGETNFELRAPEDVRIPTDRTLIIDEASMVSADLWRDISFMAKLMRLNVVLIGDGFQLPPVETKGQQFSVFSSDFVSDYRVTLTEVLRQALESPIVRVAQSIRTAPNILAAIGDMPTVPLKNLEEKLLVTDAAGGAILCHRNATRKHLNSKIRALRGLGEELVVGEPLMVTRNNYDLEVFNGETYRIAAFRHDLDSTAVSDRYLNKSQFMRVQVCAMEGLGEVSVSADEVFGKADDFNPKSIRKQIEGYLKYSYRRSRELSRMAAPFHVNATLGYVSSVHKAQGSEFDEVLVLMENSVRLNTQEGRRFLYTAWTRARKNASVCWYDEL